MSKNSSPLFTIFYTHTPKILDHLATQHKLASKSRSSYLNLLSSYVCRHAPPVSPAMPSFQSTGQPHAPHPRHVLPSPTHSHQKRLQLLRSVQSRHTVPDCLSSGWAALVTWDTLLLSFIFFSFLGLLKPSYLCIWAFPNCFTLNLNKGCGRISPCSQPGPSADSTQCLTNAVREGSPQP